MINNVVLVGRAGADPEITTFASGSKVASVNIALSRKAKGEKVTDWFQVKFWDKNAEIAEQYLKKGHLFSVTGELHLDNWEDKNGEKKSKPLIVGRLTLMQPKGDDGAKQTTLDIFGGTDEIVF